VGQEPPFARIHRGCGTRPKLRGSGLDLDEHQAIVVAKDEIDFATSGSEVGGQEFQAQALQVSARVLFAQFAAP
jgi:hypothetical protein